MTILVSPGAINDMMPTGVEGQQQQKRDLPAVQLLSSEIEG